MMQCALQNMREAVARRSSWESSTERTRGNRVLETNVHSKFSLILSHNLLPFHFSLSHYHPNINSMPIIFLELPLPFYGTPFNLPFLEEPLFLQTTPFQPLPHFNKLW